MCRDKTSLSYFLDSNLKVIQPEHSIIPTLKISILVFKLMDIYHRTEL